MKSASDTGSAFRTRRGSSSSPDEKTAVAELRRQLRQEEPKAVLVFSSPKYDLTRLAEELRASFSAPILGCTTAGQIGAEGFTRGGITGVSLAGDVSVRTYAIDLSACESEATRIAAAVAESAPGPGFGLLLVDGLSLAEERLASALYRALPSLPIVGGSAGDDLTFERTHILVDGEFRTGAAVFAHFRTDVPFTTFKFEHFVPTEKSAVITRSEPETRVIREINGEPAARAYAQLVGVRPDQLDSRVFSSHPLLLELGGEQYIRSIYRANSDESMTLFCAIEDGVVLSVGRTIDPMQAAISAFRRVRERIGDPGLVIGCDCILRRLEFEGSGILEFMGSILADHHVVGFSTFGEQYNGVHVNQTFTGVAIGT